MAMHIDMNYVLKDCAGVQGELSLQWGERYRVSRVCVRATVFHANEFDSIDDDLQRASLALDRYGTSASWKKALDWQADPDDEVEDWQVFRNLQRVAETVIPRYEESCGRNGDPIPAITTLTASLQIPTVGNLAQGRALSSFRRYSLSEVSQTFSLYGRSGYWRDTKTFCDSTSINNDLQFEICSRLERPYLLDHSMVDRENLANHFMVRQMQFDGAFIVLQTQFDIVDLCSRVFPPPWCPGKRRRGPLDPILPPSPRPPQEDTSKRPRHAKSAPFNGVRERVRSGGTLWMAEMRQGQNKVWIGDFKSEAQAARAIDAAHYYYGRRDRLNFPDAPQLLSARPKPAALLDDVAKLQFVKKEAKWLASKAPKRPSSPSAREALENIELSEGRLAATFELRSLSEIVAEPATDSAAELGDAVSQLQLANLMPDSGANGTKTMEHDMGASMECPMQKDFTSAWEFETMDAMSGFQMLQEFLLRSPSPAPGLQMDDRFDWLGNAEGLPEQESEEIWRLIEQ